MRIARDLVFTLMLLDALAFAFFPRLAHHLFPTRSNTTTQTYSAEPPIVPGP